MSDNLETSENKIRISSEKTLSFETRELHMGVFTYTYNSEKEEFISGGEDYLMKFLPFNELTARETIECESQITSILYDNKKIFKNFSEKIYMSDYETPKENIFLSKLTSNIKKILFNKKFNFIVCYDEDDNLHVINIETKKVFLLKTPNESVIKHSCISKDEKYFICSGVDGTLSLFEFNEEEGLKLKQKVNKIFEKNFNDSVNDYFDINHEGIIAIAGENLLREIKLNDFVNNKVKVETVTEIFHVNQINVAKFINDNFLLTCDNKNIIKIWDFKNKKILAQFNNSKENKEIPIKDFMIIFDKNDKNKYNIIYGDDNGSIKISENLQIPVLTKTEEEKEFDALVDELANDNLENNNNNNNNNNNENLNLSDIEDSEGNLLNKEEIKENIKERQQIEEAKKIENNLKNIDINFLKEKLNIGEIQEPFTSGATLGYYENNQQKYLLCNLTGRIISKIDSNNIKSIDVIFSDNSNKKKINFIDANEYSLASMNEIGMILANKVEEENLDEYEAENKRKNAQMEFKSIRISTINFLNDWTYTFPEEENPVLLCMGSDWCCAYTSMGYLRIFSIFGKSEKITLSVENTVLAVTGYENYLAYAYTSSVPFSNAVMLKFKILDKNKNFSTIYENSLPISPESSLIFFQYSKEGILISYDSYNILRGFFFEVQNNWIPLLDLGEKYSGKNMNFWVVGVEDREVFGIEIKGDKIEPNIENYPVQKTWNLIGDKNDSDYFFKKFLFIAFDERTFIKYNQIKNIRSVILPEYSSTEFLKDENEIKKMKKENDKTIVAKINECLIEGDVNMVIILFEYLFLKKSKEIVINICMEYNKEQIAMYLNYKNNLNEIIKQQSIKDGNTTVVQYYSNETNNNKNINNKKILDEENELANAAINLKGFQNFQNDIKNELELKGILSNNNENNNENKSNEEEIRTETTKKNNLPNIININNKKNEQKQTHDLFNDLGKFGSKTPNDNNNIANNNNNSKIITKRKHKELNSTISFEQKPTKKLKK